MATLDDVRDTGRLFDLTFALFRALGRGFRREREDLFHITPTQYHVLALVRDHGPATLMEVAALLRVAGPTATRAVEALAQKGLVVKDRDPQDRRMVWLRLSPRGEDLLGRERLQQIRHLEVLLGRLEGAEQRQLCRLLAKMLEGEPGGPGVTP
ncbi:MAG: MarR family winged helix-turn-helix transcriptional regulator [Firmicutes bacterium]|nr:MarR family winged helix-turn-helix transcriptional regulator [Bacillota bacterium]